MNKERIEKKLEESYQHIKPYLKEQKILEELCQGCEEWYGENHDYEECRNRPCFKMFLGYEYMCWEDSFRSGE